jgi:hypothetical protein
MSKFRAEMKEALKNLDAATPLRIPTKLAFEPPSVADAPQGTTSVSSCAKEETGSNLDRVQNSPGQKLTGSNFDPLDSGGEKNCNNSSGLEPSPSETDPVKFEQGRPGFTQVPHAVLRLAGLFEEPIDFMVYLHLFTFSWGYQRETVDMGLTQLERFTGAARNTVRRSLDRLSEKRWIIEVQKQEPGQVSRKWKVRNPAPKDPENTGSKTDRVKHGPGQTLTPRGSNPDPVTGSKMDPYIESSKQSFKETLSPETEELRKYFDSIKAPRKRESELKAFRELRAAHPEADISVAFAHVQSRGVGEKGEPCHSPMAYLAKAIESVIRVVREGCESRRRQREQLLQAENAERLREQELAYEERQHQEREEALIATYPEAEAREQALRPYLDRFSGFMRQPELIRRLAIRAWRSDSAEANQPVRGLN